MKKLLTILLLIFITLIAYLVVNFESTPSDGTINFGADEKIADNLKLKATEDKILESRDIYSTNINKTTGIIEIGDKVKSYDYISDKKAVGDFIFDGNDKFTNRKIIKKTSTSTEIAFYTADSFYKDDNGVVYEIEHGATTTIEAFNNQIKNSLLKKVTFFFTGKNVLAADYYSGTGDGWVSRENQGTWAAAHDTADGTNSAGTETICGAESQGAARYDLYRGFISINTSGIDDAAVISSATLNLYMWFALTSANDTANIVQSSQSSPTSLGTGDFNDSGTTLGSDSSPNYTTISDSAYTSFILNSTGTGWISKTGYTMFGIKAGRDISNTTPALNTRSSVFWYNSSASGTSNDPYLSVTFSTPTPPSQSSDIIFFQ